VRDAIEDRLDMSLFEDEKETETTEVAEASALRGRILDMIGGEK
jgi:hypothetical protein